MSTRAQKRERINQAVRDLWLALRDGTDDENMLGQDDYDLMIPVTKHRGVQERLDSIIPTDREEGK